MPAKTAERAGARDPLSPTERSARTTLLWGAGVLAAGLALVGTGADEVGAIPVLVGLFLTIFGIHVYGRLGPEGGEGASAGAVDPVAARSAAWDGIWQGGLTGLAGLAMVISIYYGTKGRLAIALGAMLGGAGRAWMGWMALQQLRRAERKKAKVEKRRRMDKSPPP